MVEVTCRYAQSARNDDVVQIENRNRRGRRASLSFEYRIRPEAGSALLATGTKQASINPPGQIVRIPQSLLDAIKTAAN